MYLILEGAATLFATTAWTITTIYRVQVAHLGPLQLVLVGTAMEVSIFLFQVPTGVLADVFSRRLSVITGVFIMGAAFVLEGLFPVFPVILLASATYGLGLTFMNGATEAWVAEELGVERAGQAYMRATQVAQLGGLAGILLSVALAVVRLNLPLLVAGLLTMALGVFLALFMTEHRLTAVSPKSNPTWRTLGATLGDSLRLVQRRPALWTILGVGFFLGLYSEGYDRLGDAHILKDLTFPTLFHLNFVVWFGVMDAGARILSLGGTEVVRRNVNLMNHRAVALAMLAMTALLSASVIAFGLAGSFWVAVLLVWAIAVLRRAIDPVYNAWIIQHTDPAVRATVISLRACYELQGRWIN